MSKQEKLVNFIILIVGLAVAVACLRMALMEGSFILCIVSVIVSIKCGELSTKVF